MKDRGEIEEEKVKKERQRGERMGKIETEEKVREKPGERKRKNERERE